MTSYPPDKCIFSHSRASFSYCNRAHLPAGPETIALALVVTDGISCAFCVDRRYTAYRDFIKAALIAGESHARIIFCGDFTEYAVADGLLV